MKKSKRVLVSLFSAALLAGAATFTTHEIQNAQDPQASVVQASSYINDYINAQGFGNPSITTYNSSFTNYFGYRNGVGRPEGIVVHETANPNSVISGEVSYMMNNWNSIYSYVHGFVDHSQIINIHPTDYGVWGAGPVANYRYIQIELVREHTTDNFARSVNNDAYYVAYLLKHYGLTPSLADHTGSGTVWSHNAVSNWLGGTNHTDPTGYFSSWGYDMDQFYDLVVQKYNQLGGNASGGNTGGGSSNADSPTSTTDVSKRATIHGTAANGVYYLLDNKFQAFGSSADYDGQTYDVYKLAKTKNGVEMALVGSDGVGAMWINSNNLEYVANTTDAVKSQSDVMGTARMNSYVQTYYFVDGNFTKADRFGSQNVTIQQKIETNSGKIYYLVQTDRDLRWVSNYDLSNISEDRVESQTSENGTAYMKYGQTYYFVNNGFSAADKFGNQNVDIQGKIRTVQGNVYYLVNTDRDQRWVKATQLSNIVSDDGVTSQIDFNGQARLSYGTLTYYLVDDAMITADVQNSQTVQVTKKATTGNGDVYYLLTKNNQGWRWVKSSDVVLE